MRRRDLITLLGAALARLAGRSVPARAQDAERTRRVGVLTLFAETDPASEALLAVFRDTLQGLGWSEGANIRYAYRWIAGDSTRVDSAATQMVRLEPDAILAVGTPLVFALRLRTRAIPIVFALADDLDRLDGRRADRRANITGITSTGIIYGAEPMKSSAAPPTTWIASSGAPNQAISRSSNYPRAARGVALTSLTPPARQDNNRKRPRLRAADAPRSGRKIVSIRKAIQLSLVACAAIGLAVATRATAADVTAERLVNTAAEPQNWLMVHHDYNNSRHAALKDINRDNVKDLQLKFIFSIGGRSTGGTLPGKEESTPLVDDGFMYVSDTYDRVMKFDVRSGSEAVPLWRYDPKITKSRTNRGIAMYGNKVFISTNDVRLIALNRDSGEVVWETQAIAPTDPATGTPSPKTQTFTAAPLAVKTAGGKELVVQGESSGGQLGTRSWVGAFDANTGKLVWRTFTIPAPGEPGSETWKDNHNAWRVGGGGVWQTASYDPATNLLYYGTGDAFPTHDPEFRPGDNLFTASTIALDADTGKIVWYFQETPNEHWDFDTPSPKMLYEVSVNGETRKVVANFSRNGFFYTLDRASGQFLRADQYQEKVTWTKGIDPKTGKPIDYDPSHGVQLYAGTGAMRGKPAQLDCPWWGGAPTFFPPTLDQKRMIAYVAGAEGCVTGTADRTPLDETKDYVGLPPCCSSGGRTNAHGALWALDVRTGKVVGKAEYQTPNESGMLSTDGDLLFSGHPDGRLVAYDSDSLKELWSFSLGTPITAPPMSYSVNGKQYVAVVAGGANNLRGAGLRQPAAIVAVFGR